MKSWAWLYTFTLELWEMKTGDPWALPTATVAPVRDPLEGTRWRVREQDADILLWPLCAHVCKYCTHLHNTHLKEKYSLLLGKEEGVSPRHLTTQIKDCS